MSEQYWGCSDKMSEVNFSPAETLNYFEFGPVVWEVHAYYVGMKESVSLASASFAAKNKTSTKMNQLWGDFKGHNDYHQI